MEYHEMSARLIDTCHRVFGVEAHIAVQWHDLDQWVGVEVITPIKRDPLTQSMQEMDVILAAQAWLSESSWQLRLCVRE
jgi:hypothetical protein